MKLINKYLCVSALAVLSFGSCKKELNVGNPNQPTISSNVTNESGLLSLANGGIYINGFGNSNLGWLGNSYFSLPYGYSELLGDMVAAEAANQIVNIINIPDYYILDDNSRITNVATHRSVMRRNNTRAATGQGNNPTYYHWTALYALNNACNQILELVDVIPMTGDVATKRNTIKAFCYFWKGWAYQQVGSVYYAGLIVNSTSGTNGSYKSSADILAESNSNFNRAATILGAITANADYTKTLGTLIPSFCQTGNGGILTPAEWTRNINTMLARNILVNKLNPFVNGNPTAVVTGASCPAMTAADWNQVKTLCTNGIRTGDKVFTGRTAAVNGFFSSTSGSVAAQATNPNRSSTFKVSERFIQNFKTGDARLSNNFNTTNTFTSGGPFGTRYSQIDGGLSTPSVYVYGARAVGAYELYIAGSYEENALMMAEAEIELGNINTGLGFINAVRSYQGAGIAPVTGLNLAQAMSELVRERRVALVYRGLSFFDSRRWGWIYDISKGGGFYKGVVLNGTTVNTNVTINYNFLDYWDVPADEAILNPPASGSFAVVNPN